MGKSSKLTVLLIAIVAAGLFVDFILLNLRITSLAKAVEESRVDKIVILYVPLNWTTELVVTPESMRKKKFDINDPLHKQTIIANVPNSSAQSDFVEQLKKLWVSRSILNLVFSRKPDTYIRVLFLDRADNLVGGMYFNQGGWAGAIDVSGLQVVHYFSEFTDFLLAKHYITEE